MKTTLKPTERKYLKHLAKNYILLPTKFKRPLVKNWNNCGKSYYLERKNIEELLTTNQEYSLRTGKKISQHYYFIAIDLDDIWAQERIKVSRYVITARGIHCYIWIRELPKSCWLVNKFGKKVGELHSKGRFVVGIGSLHETGIRYTLKGSANQKWGLKIENLAELQEFLKVREIFPTPWGKTGTENITNLEPFQLKPTPAQKYFQRKQELEQQVNNHPHKENLNICYICLVYFAKQPEIIKAHLSGNQHQKNWKTYQQKKPKTFPQNGLLSGKDE